MGRVEPRSLRWEFGFLMVLELRVHDLLEKGYFSGVEMTLIWGYIRSTEEVRNEEELSKI